MSSERYASETADDCNVISSVVPPADIMYLINSDVMLENANNERNRCDPAMPDTPKEACGTARGVDPISWHAAC